VAEYLHDTPALGARTLFATHYHELADLAALRERVRNGHFEVREWGDDVIFLRRLVPGEASRSYGIQVARLAGLPAAVIQRAREILRALESGELRMRELAADSEAAAQLRLFEGGEPRPAPAGGPTAEEREVLDALRAADPEHTTPIDALLLLQRLRARLGGGGS
jgi:DNA mismatch repair protein MutS